MTTPWWTRDWRAPSRFLALTILYAAFAGFVELAGGPRYRSAVLLGQLLVLLPYAAAVLRGARAPGPRATDLERRTLIVTCVVVAAAVLAIASYWDRGILWGDETAYRVQAQIFAQGKPWIEAPSGPSSEELRFNHLIVDDGRWFAKYPPLWPVLLALGDLAHARWLINPALAAVALWIVHRIARRELALPHPRFAVFVLVVSPFFFMMAASQMSHMLALVCCSGAALAFLSGVRTQRVRDIAAAIGLLAVCCFVRPFTAFCAAIALGPWLVASRVRPMLPRIVPIAIAAACLVLIMLGLYNRLYTGDALVSPYALYRRTALPSELSVEPRMLLTNMVTTARWALQDTMIFTWPLMFALAGYALWAERSFHDRFLTWFFVVFAVANLFHTEGSSSRFGDRYLFEAIWAPALLAARGAALIATRWSVPRRTMRILIAALTTAGAIQAVVMIRPILREIRPYVQVHAAVDALPDDGSLVFFPITEAFTGDRFDLNTPSWRDAPHMFLVDPGPARRAAVAAAVGRDRWIVLGYDATARQPIIRAAGEASP